MGGPCAGVLVDLVVGELVATGNVLAAHGVVHVGLDATGSNAVDSDLLLTGVYEVVSMQERDGHVDSERKTYQWPCTW